eukprot:TRINITY_DN11869_c0_g1_i5.p1 TRINITY_DN11869_c0_g1~~TRINITY_DN11869_c0_g1_i5.p1  ORF type:complete len:325 (-),score=35.91 TRINITY_DN11869_c0_g1_i5:86-1060(-)
MKVLLDENSRDFFISNMSKIEEEHTRALIWIALWNMVRDARLSGVDFVTTIIDNIDRETDPSVIELVLNYAMSSISSFIPTEFNQKFMMTESLFIKLKSMITDQREKHVVTILKNYLIQAATDENSYAVLVEWFEGRLTSISHVELGIDSRWKILLKIFKSNQISLERKLEYLKDQQNKDKSDSGRKITLQLEALIADDNRRDEIWNSFFDKNTRLSVKDLASVMQGFNDALNRSKMIQYHQEYFQKLKKINEYGDREFGIYFFDLLAPAVQDYDEIILQYTSIVKDTSDDQIWLKRKSIDRIDNLERQKRAQSFCRKNTKRIV